MAANPDSVAQNSATAPSDGLVGLLYADLHRAAQRERFRAGRPDTLQTTAVLHEAYLRLYDRPEWESREHFLAIASTAMRYVLVDAARARLAAKRGGGERALPIEEARHAAPDPDAEMVRLGGALAELAALDPDLAQLVDLRFFAGMTEVEAAAALGVSDRTIRRRWLQARAWLYKEMTV